jgi:hypothetical protein
MRAVIPSENITLLREMHYFTPTNLLTGSQVKSTDIEHICDFYNLDCVEVARERNEFVAVFEAMCAMSHLNTASAPAINRPTSSSRRDESDELDNQFSNDEPETVDTDGHTDLTSGKDWIKASFTQPLRTLEELSGFSNLYCLMKILATIAVTSCSAERAMSRIKIVKNRLRSTMLDDWFSSLVILASERDVLDCLQSTEVIDNFALNSEPLRRMLCG